MPIAVLEKLFVARKVVSTVKHNGKKELTMERNATERTSG